MIPLPEQNNLGKNGQSGDSRRFSIVYHPFAWHYPVPELPDNHGEYYPPEYLEGRRVAPTGHINIDGDASATAVVPKGHFGLLWTGLVPQLFVWLCRIPILSRPASAKHRSGRSPLFEGCQKQNQGKEACVRNRFPTSRGANRYRPGY